jgi:hypothetical protein
MNVEEDKAEEDGGETWGLYSSQDGKVKGHGSKAIRNSENRGKKRQANGEAGGCGSDSLAAGEHWLQAGAGLQLGWLCWMEVSLECRPEERHGEEETGLAQEEAELGLLEWEWWIHEDSSCRLDVRGCVDAGITKSVNVTVGDYCDRGSFSEHATVAIAAAR